MFNSIDSRPRRLIEPGKPYLRVQNIVSPIVPAAATPFKIVFDTLVTDTHKYWDATNFRYTPLIAGRYRVNLNSYMRAAGVCAISGIIAMADIRLNGTTVQKSFNSLQLAKSSGAVDSCAFASTEVQINGDKDYIEGWGYSDDTNPAYFSSPSSTWMEITRVGA